MFTNPLDCPKTFDSSRAAHAPRTSGPRESLGSARIKLTPCQSKGKRPSFASGRKVHGTSQSSFTCDSSFQEEINVNMVPESFPNQIRARRHKPIQGEKGGDPSTGNSSRGLMNPAKPRCLRTGLVMCESLYVQARECPVKICDGKPHQSPLHKCSNQGFPAASKTITVRRNVWPSR